LPNLSASNQPTVLAGPIQPLCSFSQGAATGTVLELVNGVPTLISTVAGVGRDTTEGQGPYYPLASVPRRRTMRTGGQVWASPYTVQISGGGPVSAVQFESPTPYTPSQGGEGGLLSGPADDSVFFPGPRTRGAVVGGQVWLPPFQGWHHMVGTYDGTNLSLYLDGVLVAGPTAVPPLAMSRDRFWIAGDNCLQTAESGGNAFVALNNLTGYIANVGLYNVALSAQAVANHYSWSQAGNPAAFRYGAGFPAQYGKFAYPTPPLRGTNLWGSAVWGAFTWG
jgi:hypothetical protein